MSENPTAAAIRAEVKRFLRRMDELAVRDAVVVWAESHDGGETFLAQRLGIGNPYGQDGMMQHFLDNRIARTIGIEVADEMTGNDDPPEGEEWKAEA